MKISILTLLFVCLFAVSTSYGQKSLYSNYDRFEDRTIVSTGNMTVKGGAWSSDFWFNDMQFQLSLNALFWHPGQSVTEKTDANKVGVFLILDLSAGEKRIDSYDKLYAIVDGKRIVLDPIIPTENKVNVNEQMGDAIINAFGNSPYVSPTLLGKVAAGASVSLSQTSAFAPTSEEFFAIANAKEIEMRIGDVEFKVKKGKLERLQQFSQFVAKAIEPLKLQARSQPTENTVTQTISSEQKQISQGNPTIAQSYNSIGLEHFLKNQYQEAYEAFNKAVIADPQNGMYHYNLASALTALRKFDQAEKEMLEAVKIEPANPTYKIGLDAVRQNIKNFRQ